MKRLSPIAAASLGLAGCAAVPTATAPGTSPSVVSVAGLERVMGQSAAGLVALFGEPFQDFREEGGRKLQFANSNCVLDAYLYAQGRSEPVVTHVDARSPVGADVDRAACVEALARR